MSQNLDELKAKLIAAAMEIYATYGYSYAKAAITEIEQMISDLSWNDRGK